MLYYTILCHTHSPWNSHVYEDKVAGKQNNYRIWIVIFYQQKQFIKFGTIEELATLHSL